MKRILVTGASGFIGSFVVEGALKCNMDVWAGMRGGSSKRFLKDERINFAYLDLSNYDILLLQLKEYKQQMGGRGWDYVVHAAGATKCLKADDFYRTNMMGTKNLVHALIQTEMIPERFVFLSSLSAYPAPNTLYGKSKKAAEDFLRTVDTSVFPYVILRPTGVYGPREKDYYVMAKSIKQHVDFAVGYKPQKLTFIYVQDIVQAVFLALKSEKAVGNAYSLSDGRIYTSRSYSDLVQKELGNPWVMHITAPLWVLWLICNINGFICQKLGILSVLNRDKYNILSQRDWTCDIEDAKKDLGFSPQWSLEQGVKESVEWYKEYDWL